MFNQFKVVQISMTRNYQEHQLQFKWNYKAWWPISHLCNFDSYLYWKKRHWSIDYKVVHYRQRHFFHDAQSTSTEVLTIVWIIVTITRTKRYEVKIVILKYNYSQKYRFSWAKSTIMSSIAYSGSLPLRISPMYFANFLQFRFTLHCTYTYFIG